MLAGKGSGGNEAFLVGAMRTDSLGASGGVGSWGIDAARVGGLATAGCAANGRGGIGCDVVRIGIGAEGGAAPAGIGTGAGTAEVGGGAARASCGGGDDGVSGRDDEAEMTWKPSGRDGLTAEAVCALGRSGLGVE